MLGGDPAVDFVNTASLWSSGDPVDRLGDAEGFLNWVRAAGLADEKELAEAQNALRRDPAAAAAMFDLAVRLRAALKRIFDAAAHGARVQDVDLALLKDLACRARTFRDLIQIDGGFEDRWTKYAPSIEKPLLAIALAAERLLREAPLDRLHACGGEGCEWMFLDLSKNASRRWCSMATCGNAAKVKKFRSRKKSMVS